MNKILVVTKSLKRFGMSENDWNGLYDTINLVTEKFLDLNGKEEKHLIFRVYRQLRKKTFFVFVFFVKYFDWENFHL